MQLEKTRQAGVCRWKLCQGPVPQRRCEPQRNKRTHRTHSRKVEEVEEEAQWKGGSSRHYGLPAGTCRLAAAASFAEVGAPPVLSLRAFASGASVLEFVCLEPVAAFGVGGAAADVAAVVPDAAAAAAGSGGVKEADGIMPAMRVTTSCAKALPSPPSSGPIMLRRITAYSSPDTMVL